MAIGKDELQFLPPITYVGYKGRQDWVDLALGCGAVNAIRHILSWLVLGLAVQAHAGASGTDPAGAAAPAGGLDALMKGSRSSGDNFLPVDEAFRFDAVAAGGDAVRLNWEIADGYYLYRARIKVSTSATNVRLGAPQMPAGQVKNDEYFGRQEVYHHELIATVPVARTAGGALEVPVQVSYQGCADAGLCYPPQTKTLSVRLPAGGSGASGSPGSGPGHATGGESDQNWFATQLRNDGPLVMIGLFYLAGLALAFTPCVLPMVPILSGIIFGGGRQVTTARAFTLSLTYVLGMAVTYTAAGIACAAAGKQVQAIFQQWWVLSLFAALFVALALSMFGLFTLQMPVMLQTRLANISNRQSAGSLRRRGRHGGAVGAHRDHLCRAGTGRGAAVHQPDRPDGARRGGAVRHEHRHGDAPAARGRLGRQVPAEGGALDGPGEEDLRRHDARGRGLDAGARGARAPHAHPVGRAGAGAGVAAVERAALAHARSPGA